jgi:hypothetical protein
LKGTNTRHIFAAVTDQEKKVFLTLKSGERKLIIVRFRKEGREAIRPESGRFFNRISRERKGSDLEGSEFKTTNSFRKIKCFLPI